MKAVISSQQFIKVNLLLQKVATNNQALQLNKLVTFARQLLLTLTQIRNSCVWQRKVRISNSALLAKKVVLSA